MYVSVQELHIGIDQGLQHVDSNRKSSLQQEEKDWILNESILEYIYTRLNPKSNPKQEGFEDTQKRYDDLEVLKKDVTLKCYVDTQHENTVYAMLPVDYLHRTKDVSLVLYDCNGLTFPAQSQDNPSSVIIEFPKDSGTAPYYVGFSISFNGTTIFDINDYNLGSLNNIQSRYMIILLALEELNKRTDMEFYWENYGELSGSAYKKDSFIIVHKGGSGPAPATITLAYTGATAHTETVNFNTTNITRWVYNFTNPSTIEKPNDLMSSEDVADAEENEYFKTSYDKPNSFIEQRKLKIKHNDNFVPIYVKLSHIRRPRKISLALDQTCEIPERAEEIINIAVRKIKARINDPNYRNIINENLLQE